MTITTHTVTIDWAAIHAAATAVDEARQGTDLGRVGVADTFGGTYFGAHYERQGLTGVVQLLVSAKSVQSTVWTTVHGAARAYEAALAAVGDRPVRPFRGLRREHARRVTEWEQRRASAERVITVTRAAVRVAFALDQLFSTLAATGVCEDNRGLIARTNGDRIMLTGLAWLAGKNSENSPDGGCSLAAARAFAEHGLDALHAAIWMPAVAA